MDVGHSHGWLRSRRLRGRPGIRCGDGPDCVDPQCDPSSCAESLNEEDLPQKTFRWLGRLGGLVDRYISKSKPLR
jgi:hypothetical protein